MVARELEMARWRPKEGEVTGARNLWHLPWRAHRRSPDKLHVINGDAVKGLRRGVVVVNNADSGDGHKATLSAQVGSVWGGTVVGVYPCDDFYHPEPYPVLSGVRIVMATRIPVQDHRRRDLSPGGSIQLLYHCRAYSVGLTEQLEARFLPDFIHQPVQLSVSKL
jgi:hypothetical protein